MNLRFSIDLDAELRKITQKQHLNRVHFLVQLIRHALTHQPRSIRVRGERYRLEVIQDGLPFSEEEWRLLRVIFDENTAWQAKQAALSKLEKCHGVAILSLLLGFPHVTISSKHGSMIAEEGRVRFETAPPTRGYRIGIVRARGESQEELRELAFYSAGTDIPIFFNGKKINTSISFPGQVLVTSFRNNHGNGAVGLPAEGDLCSFSFYKNGVRLGVKQFLPSDGRVFHGYWNSSFGSFESDYNQTIQTGDRYLHHYAKVLYTAIPAHFPELNPEWKERVKRLLFGLSAKGWESLYGSTPLFHSCHRGFALSLRDLARLERCFGNIPYQPKPSSRLPAFLPSLATEEVFFLQNRLGKSVALSARPKRWLPDPRLWFRGGSGPPETIDPSSLSDDYMLFLAAINQSDEFLSFRFTNGKSGIEIEPNGLKTISLDPSHPGVDRAVRLFRQYPEGLSVWKYQLLAAIKA